MIRNRLACVGASLLLSGAVAISVSQPAQASIAPKLTVCNSVNSVGHIEVWSPINGSSVFNDYLAKGECFAYPNSNNDIRVDVDPEAGGGDLDVDSYRIGVEGQGYGPCHPGENYDSDPPNVYPKYVKYNTDASGC